MQQKLLVTAAFLALAAANAHADEIHFKNGDRLTGKLVSLFEEVIHFKADNFGDVEIDPKSVTTLSTVETIEIHTRQGTVIKDTAILAPQGGFRTAGTSEVGPQSFTIEDTVAINPPEVEAVQWSGEIKGGVKLERGNTDTDEAYAQFKTQRRTEVDRASFSARYESERNKPQSRSSAGEPREWDTTEREVAAALRYDYFLSDKLFWFATSEAEKDGMKDLDLRFVGGAGLGYDWLDTKRWFVSTGAGVSWVSENYKDTENDEDYIAALFQWSLRRLLVANVSFFHEGSWITGLGEGGERNTVYTETGLRTNITDRFFLESKAIWEWDTPPASEKKRQDVDYIFSVGYGF
jgi:putative salt-induced outer membrane protein YdiY